ncbi:YkgJ family cysteine cluster protein [Candidatus Sumerlaeota bacterium]|nr:YkgJ family cysteine cluster protein [Candidatus Sumerlaeota bacterium]
MSDLHLPAGLNYGCIQCGLSCKMFNEVSVEQASRARIEEIDYRALMHPDTRELSFLVKSPSTGEKDVLRRHCGTCVFQREDGLCGIHHAHGFPQKPQTCQDFPYRYAETPAGAYIGLSFACTAVLQNAGPAVSEQRDYLAQNRQRANAVLNFRGAVRLTHRHEISWEAYQLLEEDLHHILNGVGEPLEQRLIAQTVYIDLYAAFLREMRGDSIHRVNRPMPQDFGASGRFPADSGPATDEKALHATRRKYIERDGGAELFRIARKMKGSGGLQRAFIGLITAFRQSLDYKGKRPGRIATTTKIMRHYMTHALKIGNVKLDPLGEPFDYEAFTRIPFDLQPGSPEDELLQRFLDHSLFRKDLLAVESVWLGQRLVLMYVALIRWHAIGKAALLGRPRVDIECLREAIRIVELHYLTHTKIVTLFDKIPSLGMILDALVRKPAFAPSMMEKQL